MMAPLKSLHGHGHWPGIYETVCFQHNSHYRSTQNVINKSADQTLGFGYICITITQSAVKLRTSRSRYHTVYPLGRIDKMGFTLGYITSFLVLRTNSGKHWPQRPHSGLTGQTLQALHSKGKMAANLGFTLKSVAA